VCVRPAARATCVESSLLFSIVPDDVNQRANVVNLCIDARTNLCDCVASREEIHGPECLITFVRLVQIPSVIDSAYDDGDEKATVGSWLVGLSACSANERAVVTPDVDLATKAKLCLHKT
jgi:hypothetical protein